MARQERAVRTRQAILVAAAEVFDELGYEAATIAEVLKRAGVTKGALYFHFASKEELAQGVLAEQVHALPAVPPQDLKLQQSLDQALLLAVLLKPDTGDPLVQGGVRLIVDQGSSKDGIDRRVPMEAWVAHTLDLLQEAAERGEVLPHVDLKSLAVLLVGAFTGVQVLSNILTGRTDMTERVTDLYQQLIPSVAMPSVLARMDFDPARGAKLLAVMQQKRDEAAAEVAG
ncbi:ScbR family autoregulator-binding transcription factor [Streptomyces sp. NPDC057694]|uniref:ScbR family autoregulator-binding transcription factor n=1 Tax=Streptomyces sp. NPDC057694 TaxID=3346216 RepID=UPI0036BCCBA2